MSKEEDKIEQVLEADPFKGFSLLNEPAPKAVTKKEETVETDEELSAEETKALEDTAKRLAESAENKKKAKEEIAELETEESEVVVEDDNDLNVFLEFAKSLNEKGVIDLDDEDKVESEEDLDKLVTKTIKKGVEDYKASKSEDVQKFLDFVDNGGNPADFHKYYYNDGNGSFEDFDITEVDNQKYVIEEALKLEDWTEEEIKDELTDLEDLGKLDKKASIYLKKLQKVEKEQKSLLIEAQKAYAKEKEAARMVEWESFKKGLFEKETIGGFKITPKVQNDLWEYMTKPVNKKIGKTQYQLDSEENSDARYMFAYLLKNKWNISALEQQVQSKEVSKLKAKLNRYSDNTVKKTGVKDTKVVSESENSLEGFRKMFA